MKRLFLIGLILPLLVACAKIGGFGGGNPIDVFESNEVFGEKRIHLTLLASPIAKIPVSGLIPVPVRITVSDSLGNNSSLELIVGDGQTDWNWKVNSTYVDFSFSDEKWVIIKVENLITTNGPKVFWHWDFVNIDGGTDGSNYQYVDPGESLTLITSYDCPYTCDGWEYIRK